MKTFFLIFALVSLSAAGLFFFKQSQVSELFSKAQTPQTPQTLTQEDVSSSSTSSQSVESRLEQYGKKVRKALAADFQRAGVAYPPSELIFIILKQEKRLEVWLSNPNQLLKSYPILAASGRSGPKLREGDLQVPEGIYPITYLNPNSLFHLSLRIGYPNKFDRQKGRLEGRIGKDLGGDIMIHGNQVSIGCLAMGDEAIEEIFVLAAQVGIENIRVIISPHDFRTHKSKTAEHSLYPSSKAPWVEQELYPKIQEALSAYPLP